MIFYDFEVFKYDWLVVFINSISKSKTIIVNDKAEQERFYNDNKNQIFIGYNNTRYDQFILKSILLDFDPYEVSQFIITQQQEGWQFSSLFKKMQMINYDVANRLDKGLKTFEGFLGGDIRESSVDFNINRKLTADEIKQTIKYCESDVENTIKLFLHRYEEFESKMSLVKLICDNKPLKLSLLEKTPIQLSAMILNASKRDYFDEFNIDLPPTLDIKKYKNVVDWYEDPNNLKYKDSSGNKSQLVTDIAGVKHVFGWGGLHGAREKYHGQGYFINMDVASLYPSLMINYNLGSRSMKNPQLYEEIYNKRLKYKAEKNPLQQPLKIVLNGTYGAMKDYTNALYDPRQSNRVCAYGQLLLLDLIEKLEGICTIVQSNTDGVLIKMPEGENEDNFFKQVDDIAHQWETRTGLVLEFEEFKEVYQKDVNNYIIVDFEGNYKSKGAYVKKLSAIDYDLPIVNEAVVKYATCGIEPKDTINSCNDLIKFQMIRKISNKYSTALHGNRAIKEKALRIFASCDLKDAGVFKVHKKTNAISKINDTPNNCFIHNESVIDKPIPIKLNRHFYIEMARKRLQDFGFFLYQMNLF